MEDKKRAWVIVAMFEVRQYRFNGAYFVISSAHNDIGSAAELVTF